MGCQQNMLRICLSGRLLPLFLVKDQEEKCGGRVKSRATPKDEHMQKRWLVVAGLAANIWQLGQQPCSIEHPYQTCT